MAFQFTLGERGTLRVSEDGPRAVVEARLPEEGRGLYKAYLIGEAGRFLLGTLIPERGVLTLRRTLSVDQLRRQGVWPPTGGEAVLAVSPHPLPAGWHRADCPEAEISDLLVRGWVAALGGALLRREESGFSLALPWTVGQAFPLPPLFCLARLERLDGQCCLVFFFDGQGRPSLPPPSQSAPGGQG